MCVQFPWALEWNLNKPTSTKFRLFFLLKNVLSSMVNSKLYSCLKSYIASLIILAEVYENNTPEYSDVFSTFFFFLEDRNVQFLTRSCQAYSSVLTCPGHMSNNFSMKNEWSLDDILSIYTHFYFYCIRNDEK